MGKIKNKAKALRQMVSLRSNNDYSMDAKKVDKIVEEVETESED